MNRLALLNIFKVPEPPSRFVSVVKKIAPDRYQTKDHFNRLYNVDSLIQLKPGNNVEIQGGKVVKKTGKQPQPTTFDV